MTRFNTPKLVAAAIMLFVAAFVFLSATPLLAQATISTGSIQGTVTDPNGSVVPGAKVTISNRATGQSSVLSTNSNGGYVSGSLIPGDYTVRVESKGFQTSEANIPVQVGVI